MRAKTLMQYLYEKMLWLAPRKNTFPKVLCLRLNDWIFSEMTIFSNRQIIGWDCTTVSSIVRRMWAILSGMKFHRFSLYSFKPKIHQTILTGGKTQPATSDRQPGIATTRVLPSFEREPMRRYGIVFSFRGDRLQSALSWSDHLRPITGYEWSLHRSGSRRYNRLDKNLIIKKREWVSPQRRQVDWLPFATNR